MAATNYIWDPLSDNVVMEVDDGGDVLAEYTQEPGLYGSVVSQSRSGVESHYHYDGQGSVRQLTDSGQTVTDEATYTAFGETVTKTGSTVNPWGYKGAMGYYSNPATEDLYVRARTLSPPLSRWLSMDPIGLAGGPNVFIYVRNNPMLVLDPSGLNGILFSSLATAREFIDELKGAGAKNVRVYYSQGHYVSPILNACIRSVFVYTDYRDRAAVFKYADERLPAATKNGLRNEFLLSIGVLPNRNKATYVTGKALGYDDPIDAEFFADEPKKVSERIGPDPKFQIDIGGEGRNVGFVNINIVTAATTAGPCDSYKTGDPIPLLFRIADTAMSIPFADNSVSSAVSQQSPFFYPLYTTEMPRVMKRGGGFEVWNNEKVIKDNISKFSATVVISPKPVEVCWRPEFAVWYAKMRF